MPRLLAAPGALPLMPVPAGLRFQATHADDVAQAHVAGPVLVGRDVAEVLDHGHALGLPPWLVRRVLALAWSAHVVPTAAGWIDRTTGAPVMDTARAREVLGWSPSHGAVEALRGVLAGVARGRGRASDPLRPA